MIETKGEAFGEELVSVIPKVAFGSGRTQAH